MCYDQQIPRRQASGGSSQAIATPEEQLEPPQDILAQDNRLDQNTVYDRNLPYPYSLRPLPGRRNIQQRQYASEGRS